MSDPVRHTVSNYRWNHTVEVQMTCIVEIRYVAYMTSQISNISRNTTRGVVFYPPTKNLNMAVGYGTGKQKACQSTLGSRPWAKRVVVSSQTSQTGVRT